MAITKTTKALIRRAMTADGKRNIRVRNELFEAGFAYATDAWCGHDCMVADRRTGEVVAFKDGRKVTFTA